MRTYNENKRAYLTFRKTLGQAIYSISNSLEYDVSLRSYYRIYGNIETIRRSTNYPKRFIDFFKKKSHLRLRDYIYSVNNEKTLYGCCQEQRYHYGGVIVSPDHYKPYTMSDCMSMVTRYYIGDDTVQDYIDTIFDVFTHFDNKIYNMFVDYSDRPYFLNGIIYCKCKLYRH